MDVVVDYVENIVEKLNKYVQTEGFHENLDEWLEWDKNPQTKKEIEELLAAEDYKTLKELLGTRLTFEDSGIQGRMGAGFSRMNDLVVIQTTQGLASYLESIESMEDLKKRGIAVGFDVRHNSLTFAHLTAVTFVNRGFRVCLFAEVCPLVFVPFCVKVNKCVAGIMITGSFNSKDDNGYRVYWENGVRLIPPHDKNINDYILQNLEPSENAWDTTILEKNTLVRNPLVQITGMYFNMLRRNTPYPEINKDSKMTITYTPMHGVGYRFMVEAFRAGNLHPLFSVKEQKHIDPEFPTVELPNPYDENSLNKAILAANDSWSRLILATDPDAQYFSVVERCVRNSNEDEYSTETEQVECNLGQEEESQGQENPEWRIFTGNELATLLSWWTFYTHRQKNPDEDLGNIYMLGTAMSTKCLQSMAHTEGFNYVETAAGFKWIVDKAQQLLTEEKTVLFGYSEPYDFMIGTTFLENDGIMASLNVASLAAYLDTEHINLSNKLQELYSIYGYYINKSHSFTVDDIETFENIFYRLRNFSGEPNTYPKSLAEGEYIIAIIQDYTTGYNSLNDETILNIGPTYEMVKFVLENGAEVTITDCGTRSMIKYFVEMIDTPQEEDTETCFEIVDKVFRSVERELLQLTLDYSEPENSEFLQLGVGSSEPETGEFLQLVLGSSEPESGEFLQLRVKFSAPEKSELLQTTIDHPAPENRDFLQPIVDSSVVPENGEFLQSTEDPSVPEDSELIQPAVDSSVPEDSELIQPAVDPSVPEDSELIQPAVDPSVPEDSELIQPAVDPSVPENNETVLDDTQITE